MAHDSTSTSARTSPSEKPSVLSTASSLVRSRTDWAIVLAATSRIVKNTAVTMPRMIAPMSPICFANACTNAFSVVVFVSANELANFASMRSAISGASAGSSMRMTYQPTRPCPNCRASSK